MMLVTCQAHAHVRADEEIRGLEVQMQNGGILWEGRNGQWFKFLEDYVILHWQGNLRPAIQEGTCALDRCTPASRNNMRNPTTFHAAL